MNDREKIINASFTNQEKMEIELNSLRSSFEHIDKDIEAILNMIELPGLKAVLIHLHVGNPTKLHWLITPNKNLNNNSPLLALKKGFKQAVIEEATCVGYS